MRVPKNILYRKEEFALDIIREEPGIKTKALQLQVKKQFGTKLAPNKIKLLRLRVLKEKEGKKAIREMEHVGRKGRLQNGVKLAAPKIAWAQQEEIVLERNAQDIAGIIMRRLPGVKYFHLDIDQTTGKPRVKYSVTTEKTGSFKL